MIDIGATSQINFAALIRLRWAAILGQLTVVLTTRFALGVEIDLTPLLGMLALESATNLALALWARGHDQPPASVFGGVMALDVLLLTALLAMSGGAHNPFSVLYLVHIVLATVTLSPRWSWGLTSLALFSYAALFLVGQGEPAGEHAGHGAHAGHGGAALHDHIMALHLPGMWVALAVTAIFIVYFVHRIRGELAARDDELARVAAAREREERLIGLATLSAGAAHELNTPLSTIALVAKELELALTHCEPRDEALVEDAQLIRGQVDRCQRILQQMAVDAGESMGELPTPTRTGELFEEVLEELAHPPGVSVIASDEALAAEILVAPRAISLALQGIVRNALEAASDRGLAQVVRLDVRLDDRCAALMIEDESGGMPPEVARRANEPFFTTKPTGRGMGLGLFLASTLCERLDGRLTVAATEGEGTTITLDLPRHLPPPHPEDQP